MAGPLDPSTDGNWWQYSRWVRNISRNSRVTPLVDWQIAGLRTFLKGVWNPITATGTRPWLDTMFKNRAVAADTPMGGYICDLDKEPYQVLIALLNVVGRDFKKIPMTNYEKEMTDILITNTAERRLGTGPHFGSVGGSVYDLPH